MWRSLGTIIVAAPGTRTRLTANQSDPSMRIATQSLLVQALYTPSHKNTGNIYLYDTQAGGSPLAILAVPTANSIPSASVTVPNAPGPLNIADFWMDADSGGDGGVVSRIGP